MSMRNIYRKIAKENGTTAAEVKQEIQSALNATYENESKDVITKAYQSKVPRKNKVPTADEFICYAAKKGLAVKSYSRNSKN